MSELEQGASGSDTSASGEVKRVEDTSGSSANNAAYDKVLREKQNAMKALAEAKAKLSDFETKEKEREENDLLQKDEHLKLIDLLKREKADILADRDKLKSTIAEGKKNSAILNELKKLGFVDNADNREAALKLIDKSMVSLDNDTGVVMGADLSAKTFHEKFHGLGLFARKVAGASNQAPQMLSDTEKPLTQMSEQERWELITKLKNKGGKLNG